MNRLVIFQQTFNCKQQSLLRNALNKLFNKNSESRLNRSFVSWIKNAKPCCVQSQQQRSDFYNDNHKRKMTLNMLNRCIKKNSNSNDEIEKSIVKNEDKIFTIPNILTLSRILSTPFISYFVFIDQHTLACALFVYAAVTDFLDGYIARNVPNQKSNLGSILDPLADKLLIGSLTITLALTKMLPIELAFIILTRDIALIFASLVIRYKTLDKPVNIEKFFNVKKYSSVKVEADLISKFNTFLQLSLISLTLPSVIFGYNDAQFLLYLQYLTGLTTILSSISYLYKGGSYKLIKK